MADVLACEKCGYELTGLPSPGRCPECGRDYDLETGRGTTGSYSAQLARQDRVLSRVRTISVAVLAVFTLICSGVVNYLFTAPRAMAAGVVVAVLLAIGSVVSYLYEPGRDG